MIGKLDVTNTEGMVRTARAVHRASCRLDILVNNAGVLTTGAFQDVPLKTHEQMIDINFYLALPLAGLHAAFPYLRDTPREPRWSTCARPRRSTDNPSWPPFGYRHGFDHGAAEALELEWRRYGIRVLAVWPLFVQTAMTDGVETGSTKTLGIHLKPDVAKAGTPATHPGRRWLTRCTYPVGRLTGSPSSRPAGRAADHKDGDPASRIELEGLRGGCWFCWNDRHTPRLPGVPPR